MGGVWERLIQSIKKILSEILVQRFPREYVLRTVFCEAENIINSRPLTKVSADPFDDTPLTPNHFLIGRNNIALACSDNCDRDLNLISQW